MHRCKPSFCNLQQTDRFVWPFNFFLFEVKGNVTSTENLVSTINPQDGGRVNTPSYVSLELDI